MRLSSRQKGIALLVFVSIMATAAAAATVKALNHSSQNHQIARDKITASALAQAKEALIGYAITYGDKHQGEVHGYLPCPDASGTALGGEGAAEGICGAKDISAIGRLPWKTLDLMPLRGGDNECLWYAVSGSYKYNPKTGLMNWDTNGQLQVYASDGTTLLTPADNQAVAVIFAPGTIASGQDRSGTAAPQCGGNYTPSNYLDVISTYNNANVSGTAGANSAFRIGDASINSSDRIIFITKQDLWNAMKRRQDLLAKLDDMTLKTAKCIANFGRYNQTGSPPTPNLANKSLPWPAQLPLSDYTDNTRYNDADDQLVGRVPYRVNTARNTTRNTLFPVSDTDYYLLKSSGLSCSSDADWVNTYIWWANWKDHLFYAVSERYKPDHDTTMACTSGHCVSVNGTSLYAAVVIFAGDRLTSQLRNDKSVISAYLEGRNASNISEIHSGHGNYQAETTTLPSTTFNDIVYCIKEDLSVVRGNAAGCP